MISTVVSVYYMHSNDKSLEVREMAHMEGKKIRTLKGISHPDLKSKISSFLLHPPDFNNFQKKLKKNSSYTSQKEKVKVVFPTIMAFRGELLNFVGGV